MRTQLIILLVLGSIRLSAQAPDVQPDRLALSYSDSTASEQVVQVFVGTPSADELKARRPMLGRTVIKEDTLLFLPVIDFQPGGTYTLRLVPDGYTTTFSLPLPDGYAPATLETIYPSDSVWPSNLLKVHLYFSAPVAATNVYDHIYLTDSTGSRLDRIFLPLQPPLWNEDRTRLTLWIEPGRTKRDLGPNRRLGPALLAGHSYQLHVSRELKDQLGQPLAQSYQFTFRAGPPDRAVLQPDTWEVVSPPHSTAPLTLLLPESLDYVTASTYLRVETEQGSPVASRISYQPALRQWQFQPTTPWLPGRYRLRIDPRVEDLAGNRLHRLFDRGGSVGVGGGERFLEFVVDQE